MFLYNTKPIKMYPYGGHSVKIRKKLTAFASVLVGNIILTFAIKLFLLPSGLMSNGTTGLALVMEHLTGMPVSVFSLIFNIAMLILGWIILGKQFAATTLFSSIFYPLFLELLNRTIGDYQITENIFLNLLFAGMGTALGLGLIIRAGASSGGMDIPPLILERFFKIPVSVSLWCFDFVILMAQLPFHKPEDLLYGILLILTISITLNKSIHMGATKTEVKIISDKAPQIRDAVLNKVERGVTLLHGESGYLHRNTEVVLTVIASKELAKIERVVREVDPACFIIVNRVSEVWGRGFTKDKKD